MEPKYADDFRAVEEVRKTVEARLNKLKLTPGRFFENAIRQATDEVLSLGRGQRWTIDQLDPTEKTYIGTRVEILIRDGLGFERGERADALMGKHEVDIKWSRSLQWMIAPRNLGVVCLGIGTNTSAQLFSAGLFVPRFELMRRTQNRDKKYSPTAAFYTRHVEWLVLRNPLKPSFFGGLEPHIREEILKQPSAQERMKKLANLLPYTPIPRSAIVFAASKKADPLRRLRADAARKFPPLGEMVSVSQKYGKHILDALGVVLPPDHFYFINRKHLEEIEGSRATD